MLIDLALKHVRTTPAFHFQVRNYDRSGGLQEQARLSQISLEADEERQHEEADQPDQQAQPEQGVGPRQSSARAKSRRGRVHGSGWQDQRGPAQDPGLKVNAESRAGTLPGFALSSK